MGRDYYSPLDHICISNDRRDLRVTVSPHRAFIDVRTADNSEAVVDNHNLPKVSMTVAHQCVCAHLAVNVHLLRGQNVPAELAPIAQGEE